MNNNRTYRVSAPILLYTHAKLLQAWLAFLLAGIDHHDPDLDTKFWRRRRVPFGERDVVLRTDAFW